jgi:hypothetical protein
MQIADGRKSLQEIRDGTAQRVRTLRQNPPLQGRRNEEQSSDATAKEFRPLPRPQTRAAPALANGAAHQLIDALIASSSGTRETAAKLLINGTRQSQFEPASNAVIDLYQTLARTGR